MILMEGAEGLTVPQVMSEFMSRGSFRDTLKDFDCEFSPFSSNPPYNRG